MKCQSHAPLTQTDDVPTYKLTELEEAVNTKCLEEALGYEVLTLPIYSSPFSFTQRRWKDNFMHDISLKFPKVIFPPLKKRPTPLSHANKCPAGDVIPLPATSRACLTEHTAPSFLLPCQCRKNEMHILRPCFSGLHEHSESVTKHQGYD